MPSCCCVVVVVVVVACTYELSGLRNGDEHPAVCPLLLCLFLPVNLVHVRLLRCCSALLLFAAFVRDWSSCCWERQVPVTPRTTTLSIIRSRPAALMNLPPETCMIAGFAELDQSDGRARVHFCLVFHVLVVVTVGFDIRR